MTFVTRLAPIGMKCSSQVVLYSILSNIFMNCLLFFVQDSEFSYASQKLFISRTDLQH